MLALHQRAAQLHSNLEAYHASFLCTQCRGYKSSNTDEPRRVRFSNDSAHLFVGTNETAAWKLNTKTGESSAISTAGLPCGLSFNYANFTRDGERVYWGSREGPTFLVKPATSEQVRLECLGYGERTNPIAVSHDETHILVSSTEINSAALCDATTGETLMTFEGHSKRIGRAAFASAVPPRKQISDRTQEIPYQVDDLSLCGVG
jgi:hypothetical protein